MILNGTAVSKGVAAAPAYVYIPKDYTAVKTYIKDEEKEKAIADIKDAIACADKELKKLIKSFLEEEQEEAKIFSAHLEILHDEDLYETICSNIKKNNIAAEYAVSAACDEFITLLSAVDDENIAMRTADIADVRSRVIRCLRGEQVQQLGNLKEDCIIVAKDLLPSDTASMDRTHILGIVTELGGVTSHTAILARSYQIPALVGADGVEDAIKTGDLLLIDTQNNTVAINPSKAEVDEGMKKRTEWMNKCAEENTYLRNEARTKDGERIQIGLNIGSDDEDIPEYVDFVGLLRTEFIYMNSDHIPTEEEQFSAYRCIIEKAEDRVVTLRTLDIGGDKSLPYMSLPKEENPFLGKRALRLCFEKPELFNTQLRAALRASAYGKLQIMFPMVSSIDDIQQAKACVEKAKTQLRAEDIAFDENIRIGIMIEIPSIAMIADIAAQEVDFASIGTNDLCQYFCAVDRMNPALGKYYQPYSTSFLRMLSQIITAFNTAKKEISICGEIAGDPDASKLLLGLGLRKFSMSRSSVASVKAVLSQCSISDASKAIISAL